VRLFAASYSKSTLETLHTISSSSTTDIGKGWRLSWSLRQKEKASHRWGKMEDDKFRRSQFLKLSNLKRITPPSPCTGQSSLFIFFHRWPVFIQLVFSCKNSNTK
jgi:hypothetical protein